MDSKNILLSKTFWLNIAGLAATMGEYVPPKYSVPLICAANVINRVLFTKSAVNLIPPMK